MLVNIRSGLPYDIYIGRPKAGQSWGFGNPFSVDRFGRGVCIGYFEEWLRTGDSRNVSDATEARRQWILENLPSIQGKRLGCFCHPNPCHGSVLVKMAAEEGGEPMAINQFRGQYSFLSNFHLLNPRYRIPVQVGDEVMMANSSEHAFMACKTLDPSTRREILSCPSPAGAKQLGKRVALRLDWEEIKVFVMAHALRKKFLDPDLRRRLKDTAPRLLVEGNTWHDNTWGKCTCIQCAPLSKANILGTLLMELRDSIE